MPGTVNSIFLIVDDEPDMCWALQHILEAKGFVSKTALTGHDALALMAVNIFEMVFLDAKLPDMEGIELARRIHEMNPNMHIVMVSGYFYRDDATVREAFEDGLITDFISKPFLNSEIYATVKLLTQSPQPNQA